jgi:hypothetical protein
MRKILMILMKRTKPQSNLKSPRLGVHVASQVVEGLTANKLLDPWHPFAMALTPAHSD